MFFVCQNIKPIEFPHNLLCNMWSNTLQASDIRIKADMLVLLKKGTRRKVKWKSQGVPQSQATASPWHQSQKTTFIKVSGYKNKH